MLTFLIFIIVLGLIVFVHEFGHFIAAKRSGVRVDEFGFGFPPRIVGVKCGNTTYSINWIPLGGFVKIKGESGEDRDDADSFAHKPAWQRGLILLAGVAMNVVLAIVLLSIGLAVGAPNVTDGLPPSAIVHERAVQVMAVLPGSPAERAGFTAGDSILSVDTVTIRDAEDLRARVTASEGAVSIEIKKPAGCRSLAEATTALAPDAVLCRVLSVTPETLAETGKIGIGVQLANIGVVRYPWYLAIVKGFAAAFIFLWEIIVSFALLIKNLVLGKGVGADLSGPVGIAVLTGQVSRLGIMYLMQFVALLSLNLAVLNAVPFPALDGGRFLFLVIEKFRGKPVPKRAEQIAHQVGFALLMLLVLAVTYRDLVRYGGVISSFFRNLF